MAQKSSYLQGPFTQEDLIQTIRDGYAIVGADTVQTEDNSYVFDSDYWINKYVKTSTVNLAGESEMLLAPDVDYTPQGNQVGSTNLYGHSKGNGSNFYVKKNTNPAYPFSISNYINPRSIESDVYITRRLPTLSTAKNYTYSFYARKSDGKTPNSLNFLLRQVGTSSYVTKTHNITSNWQRFSGTFTPTSAETDIVIGGYSSWASTYNLVEYSEYFSAWPAQSPIVRESHAYDDVPNIPTNLNRKSTKLTYNGSSENIAYCYYPVTPGGYLRNRTFTFSIYAKLISGTPTLVITDNGTEGSAYNTPNAVINNANEWVRYSLTYTFNDASPSQTMNVHIGMKGGDSALVWGATVVEGSQPLSYFPNEGVTTKPKFIGDLEIAGLQLEEGSSVTNYSPSTNWAYLEYDTPVTINETLQAEAIGVTTFIPGGIVSHMFNVVEPEEVFFGGACGNHTNSLNTLIRNSKVYDREQSSQVPAWYSASGRISDSNLGMYSTSTSGNAIAYPADALRMQTRHRRNPGTGSSYGSVLGSRAITFGPTRSAPNANLKINLQIKGMLIKLSNDAYENGLPTSGKLRSIVINLKTPGNGKRKQINYILSEEKDSSKLRINYIPNLIASNSVGNAEPTKLLNASITKKVPYNSTGRDYQIGGYINSVLDSTPYFLKDYVELNKTSDVFNFMQGSSEGFIHAINVNSNFVFYTGAFDAVNQTISVDNGTAYSRVFYLTDSTNSYDYKIFNSGKMFGEYAIVSGPYLSGMWTYSRSKTKAVYPQYEIYGDNINFGSHLFPVYAGASSVSGVSNRGQLKNLYIAHSSAFGGSVGDIYVAKDNSKYFCFSKRMIYIPDTGPSEYYALLVKV